MGASHARASWKPGGKVVIGDLLDNKGAALVQELGDAAASIHLDVTSPDDWKTAVELAVQKFGGAQRARQQRRHLPFRSLGGLHARSVEPKI